MNQDTNKNTKYYKLFWDYVATIGFRAGHQLRSQLGLDEPNFRFRAPYSHANSKNVYIYRAIDEVQKAATCLMRWKEFFSGDDLSPYKKDVEKQMLRITEQTVLDEQALRSRKLRELLVDTILFLSTNEEIYFKDYFYFSELVEWQRTQDDRKEFYDFTSRNSSEHIAWLHSCIKELENKGIEVSKRWYLSTPTNIDSMSQVRLSTFRSKYKKVSLNQGSEIITLLAKTYLHAYGGSRHVHFSANDTSSEFRDDSGVLEGNKVSVLLINLLLKLQELSGFVPPKDQDIMSEVRSDANADGAYKELTTSSARVGDYVLAWGDLVKVVEEKKSKYGYFCYRAKYIDKPPLENITDDWFASFEIKRIGSKGELLQKVRSILTAHFGKNIDDKQIESIDDTVFEEYLSKSIKEVLQLLKK
jgi:hypothetical protein